MRTEDIFPTLGMTTPEFVKLFFGESCRKAQIDETLNGLTDSLGVYHLSSASSSISYSSAS